MKKHNTHELGGRLLVTTLILAVYMAGRSLLLYRVDPAAYQLEELNSENIMISMISGDRYQYTLFALGIMPYIMSSLIMWISTAMRSSEAKARSSPRKTARFKFLLMIAIAVAFAVSRAGGLVFKESNLDIEALKAIAVLEMTIGAIIIHGMAEQNKEHGIGAQMPIILVNILDNLVSTVQKFTWSELYNPLILCFIMSVVILIMENIIIRIRVQRVSIHNEYADKSYIAFKLDPIGIMPVMFAMTFLMLFKLIIQLLIFFFTDKNALELFIERLDLTDSTGVIVYLGIIYTLNTLFSFIMHSPGQMAEHLQKGGDSIVGVYAGKKTKRYLKKRLFRLCAFSGIVLCSMMGVSLWLALQGKISSELALLPATAMILTSISCALCREVKTYWKFDSYSFFL